jgi:hypothetical protein
MEVFGVLVQQVSITVDAENYEEAIHKAEKQLNSYNIDVSSITLFTDRGDGYAVKVHDVDLEWESALSEEPA